MFRVNYAEAVRLLHKFIDDCNESIITVNADFILLLLCNNLNVLIGYINLKCRADKIFKKNLVLKDEKRP